MSKVKVSFSVSIDGFGAAPQQSLENPMGVGGEALGEWVFATRTFERMHDKDWTFQRIHDGGMTGIDDDFFARSFLNVGAWIFGRNMFGPVRGPWPDNSWRGPWGDTPPFRGPVFVLTHYAREAIPLRGGTTFHFVTDGIHRALERATAVANGKDVCIGGGVATIQQYLRAGLIDELNLAIPPVLLGSGERFFGDLISSSSDTPVRSTSRGSVRCMSFYGVTQPEKRGSRQDGGLFAGPTPRHDVLPMSRCDSANSMQ